MDISSMLEVEVRELTESKENVTPSPNVPQSYPCQTFSKEENDFYKLTYGSDVAAVRFLRLHCTGCDEHIGSAPSESYNVQEHPVLRTLLCAKCREFYGDGTFEQGDDSTDMFCRWCANGGNLYCCSYCSNTFCSKCIKRNFDPPTIKRIEAEDSWKCFVCDPKDLFPLRSVTRALISHVETVTRILQSDRNMSPKEIEEKMHLDETKCCARKRKRRRRRTLSNSDDDEEEDTTYVPGAERSDTPPAKRRRVRSGTSRGGYSNGYIEHEYPQSSPQVKGRTEQELDPADLMMTCEQTMIEGDTEIMSPNNADVVRPLPPVRAQNRAPAPGQQTVIYHKVQKTPIIQSRVNQQNPASKSNNTMAINPVPLANLLKVALSTGAKKIKVTHTPNQATTKLVAVPMSAIPRSVASSSITFVKPPTHFLVPKNVANSMSTTNPTQPPSVIDLDSDDEPVILDDKASKSGGNENNNNNVDTSGSSRAPTANQAPNSDGDVPESMELEDSVAIDSNDGNDKNNDEELEVLNHSDSAEMMSPQARSTRTSSSKQSQGATSEASIPLKTRQRDARFKKMLKLQSNEIDSTLNELKTKVMKLVQLADDTKPQDGDLLGSALICTKRFHRAMRKALVELSHINDRVVRDYVHWKKSTPDKLEEACRNAGVDTNGDGDEVEPLRRDTPARRMSCQSSKSLPKDDITLDMVCVRDSDSESENEDDSALLESEAHTLEALPVPSEFSQILDHLAIFKRKPMALKAVGDSSVITHDKGCQAYDVPWRDYEKCIGYSLLTRAEYDPESDKELLRPVVVPDENFGKYQEQYLYHLQQIEDNGIETDDSKGIPDPNHIPLKDLIDGSSPFITDMLERLSPVTLSNGITSPTSDSKDQTNKAPESPVAMDVDLSTSPKSQVEATDGQSNETADKSSENTAPTSKAVEELVKMVTKLSEDLSKEAQQQKQQLSENDKDFEKSVTVNDEASILEDAEEQHRVDGETGDICEVASATGNELASVE
ncbi:hypothetical protein QAD02_014776 [Eretmocerus hayati]|uniref:Uncharacterized protein n=1 Tax=Eretmocerus hayati TaxID=131215 RepID=A0ACC2P6S8_9HYME|nr:hypothetical protein QAD02_014776 [Eretmocerus hayati]